MTRKAALRRKTDQAPPDRAAIAEARLHRLSSEVRQACDKFFVSRGMPARLPFAGEYPGDRSRRAGDPVEAQESASQHGTPGSCHTLAGCNLLSRRVKSSYVPEISKKRVIQLRICANPEKP